MSIQEKLNIISTSLGNIKQAIINKGSTISGNITTYADAISGIISITAQSKTVTPTTTTQTVTPDSNYNALSSVTVNGVDSSIDPNIVAENIKSGVNILGISGNVTELSGQTKTVTPMTSSQTITPDTGYNGITSVTIDGVTSAIDSNIQAENIKSGVSILGVTGTMPSAGKYGVTVEDVVGIIDNNGSLQPTTNQLNLTFLGLKTFNGRSLEYKFRDLGNIYTITFPDLECDTITNCLAHTFEYCQNLTTINFSKLDRLTNWAPFEYTFNHCTSLTTVAFPLLKTVTAYSAFNYCFSDCTNLTNIDFSSLEQIGNNTSSGYHSHFVNCFYNCTNLASITFPKLEKIYCTGSSMTNGTFANNNKVKKLYFPKLDTITYGSGASTSNQTACKNIFYGCTSLTEIHFGAANQAAIEATAGYSTAWGATNATVYFDL